MDETDVNTVATINFGQFCSVWRKQNSNWRNCGARFPLRMVFEFKADACKPLLPRPAVLGCIHPSNGERTWTARIPGSRFTRRCNSPIVRCSTPACAVAIEPGEPCYDYTYM